MAAFNGSELMQSSYPTSDRNVEYFKNGLFVAVVIGLVLGLLIGFLMLTIIVVCNRNRRSIRRSDESGEQTLQYEVKLHVNKTSRGAEPSHFCEGKWTPGCQRQLKSLPEGETGQSKLIIYGVPPQSYQQLQQTQQFQYHHHHLHPHHEQFIQCSPQHSTSSIGQKKSSNETLNIDADIQQQVQPRKLEIYDKPPPCYNSFCS